MVNVLEANKNTMDRVERAHRGDDIRNLGGVELPEIFEPLSEIVGLLDSKQHAQTHIAQVSTSGFFSPRPQSIGSVSEEHKNKEVTSEQSNKFKL